MLTQEYHESAVRSSHAIHPVEGLAKGLILASQQCCRPHNRQAGAILGQGMDRWKAGCQGAGSGAGTMQLTLVLCCSTWSVGTAALGLES